jgi:SAM-dependent methyltransferase
MWVFQWTGDQFLPAVKDAAQVYQHVHRYMYVSEFVKGRRVLDVAAGDGSGANILAEFATSVVGIVADARIAEAATERCRKRNLKFIPGSIVNIDADRSFDAIVMFDDGYSAIFSDAKRLLKSDGLFIVSTARHNENDAAALRERLLTSFKYAQVFVQGVHAVSTIEPVALADDIALKRISANRNDSNGFGSVPAESSIPSHLIGIAGDSPVTPPPESSVFIDAQNELLKEKERAIEELLESKAYQAKAMQWFESQLAERRESLASLQEAFAWHTSQINSLTKTRDYLENEIRHYQETVASHEQALAWRADQVAELETALKEGIAWYAARLADLQREADLLHVRALELDAIKASTGWKLVLRTRSIRNRMLPQGTARDRLYKKLIGFGKSLFF